MKISQKRQAAIYDAIRDPIVDLRLALCRAPLSGDSLDIAIAQIELTIWNRVKKALGVEK